VRPESVASSSLQVQDGLLKPKVREYRTSVRSGQGAVVTPGLLPEHVGGSYLNK
jgi:hypothetical protein